MGKMKKLFAMLLTLAMVLGLGMTSFAAEKKSATITINNAEMATFTYVQVIEPDTSSLTGWKFSDPDGTGKIARSYTSAFSSESKTVNAQEAIAMLIKYQDANANLHSTLSGVTAATAAQIDKALSNLTTNGVGFAEMTNPKTVTKAGVYAVKAVEAGYTYKTMAAYVGFGGVNVDGDGEEYEYPSLMDEVITAKKSSTDLTKDTTDADHAVAIGDIVTYTISTYVPYIDANAVDRSFEIKDKIDGATYYLAGTDAIAQVEIDGVSSVDASIVVDTTAPTGYDQAFTIDLSSYITADNQYAGREVTVTYTARVTEVDVENRASNHVSGVEIDYDVENLYTGYITLTKNDATDTSKTLKGAGFHVTKAGSDALLKFDAAVAASDGTNVYQYNPNGAVTEVVTGSNGVLKIEGLDIGTYHFAEITAPEGYSINENGVDAELSLLAVASAIYSDSQTISDTRLSALPSTGGIGTAIFTIGGCTIMITAAAMYFQGRRKEEQ